MSHVTWTFVCDWLFFIIMWIIISSSENNEKFEWYHLIGLFLICFCFTSAHTQWNNIFMTMNCSIIIYIYNYHYYLYIFTVIFLYFRVLAALFIVTFTERGNYTVTFIVKLTVTYWQQVSSSCCNVNDCKNNCNIFFLNAVKWITALYCCENVTVV